MPTPTWLAATAGQPAQAGQVNQFLGTHAVKYLYTGTSQASQGTAGAGAVNSNGTWVAQSFTTGAAQTAVGYVQLTLAVTGTPAPVSVQLQSDTAGNPSGTVLASTLLPRDFLSGTASAQVIPLPATVTSSTVYHIVIVAAGDVSNFYSWSKSNQVTGAHTSPDGVTWTAQAYGLLFNVFDQSSVAPLRSIYEDAGARWSALTYTANQLTGLEEYTAGQTATGYTASARTLSYSGTYLTGVA